MTNKTAQPFNSPAFIVGKERSGTTLLSSILNRHPTVCVTPETDFLYQLYQYPEGNTGFEKNWPKSLFSIIDRMNPTDDWDKPAHLVFEYLNKKPTSGKKVFIALGEVIRNRYGKKHWIEKTPNHILCLPFIRQLFPNSPIIHIIRDGRDVAQSLTKVRFGSQNFFENLWLWMDAVRRFNTFSKNDPNNITIRYEDLIQQPDKTINKICNYLNIEFYPSMLVPDGSEKSLIDQTGVHMNQVAEPIDIQKLASWKKSLSQELKKAAFMIAHKELIQYGYEDNQPKNPQVLYISEFLLLSKHHRKTYNQILYALADSKKSYLLESAVLLNAKLSSKIPHIWITTEIPLPDKEQRKTYKNIFLYLLKLIHRLILLKITGTKLVWVLHPTNNASETWVIRKFSEFLMSKLASNIIVVLDDTNKIEQTISHYHLNDKKCLFSSKYNFSQKLNALFV